LIVEMKSGFLEKARHRVILEGQMIAAPVLAQRTPILQASQSIQVATALDVAPDLALDTLNLKMVSPKTLPEMGVVRLNPLLQARASKMRIHKRILAGNANSLSGGVDYALLSGSVVTILLRFAARPDHLFSLRLVFTITD
jgi:hypothetical protein